MKLLDVAQGSPEWLAARAQHFCASDAAAAMGVSKYKTRNELLREKATGLAPEVDAAKQRLFDAGHAAEAKARTLVETLLGTELFPCVGTEVVDGMPMLASFDGISIDDTIIWESKLWNGALAADVETSDLQPHYWAQLEHALVVSGAEKAWFTTTDGTADRTRGMWYESVPERRARVLAAWKQFAEDLANYQPEAAPAPAVFAAPIESLPAVSVQMQGSLVVASNLDAFGTALRAFIGRMVPKPETDQQFADAEAECKTLKKAEDALEAAEEHSLASLADVAAARKMMADLRELARATRLRREKLVTAEKEARRTSIYQSGPKRLMEHITALNARLGKPYMPPIPGVDFAAVIKGKRSLDSMQDAVDTHLAAAKIAASAIADKIDANLKWLREHATDHAFLFNDAAQLVLKDADAFQAIAQQRITTHDAEQKAKAEARAEAERERIRAEEAARADREAREKARAEAAAAPAPAPVVAAQAPAPAAVADPIAAAPAPAANVHPMPARAAPAPATPPTLKLGEIANRLGFALTADFLRSIGFDPAAKDRGATLYHERDFPLICAALVRHIQSVQARQAA